jgi:archaellum component FlaD/FlaE
MLIPINVTNGCLTLLNYYYTIGWIVLYVNNVNNVLLPVDI